MPLGFGWYEILSTGADRWIGTAWDGTVGCTISAQGNARITNDVGGDYRTFFLVPLPAGKTWRCLVSDGAGTLVAIADTGVAVSANQGFTWTFHAYAWGGTPAFAAWNGTVFCMVLAGGHGAGGAFTSPDGVAWTSQTLPSSGAFAAASICANGSGFFVTSGASGTSQGATSADGITWTVTGAMPTPGGFAGWGACASNGSRIIALPAWPSTNYAYSDDDGATWSTGDFGQTAQWTCAVASGTYFVVAATGYTTDFMRSTTANTLAWGGASTSVANWSALAVLDSTYFFLADGSTPFWEDLILCAEV